MPVPQHLVDRFGGIDRVPEYIKRHYQRRERLQAERIEREKERRRKLDAERARVKALRRPPLNARLVRVGTHGCKIVWDHPETYAQLKPAGYWISENRNGSGWTAHGDYLKPDRLEGWLYSRWGEKVEAYVEAYYNDTALGEVYRSAVVRCEPDSARSARMDRIVAAVRTYAGRRTRRGEPWLIYLRKHAGMPDITSGERTEAHGLANS